jgi:hypothetical protein
MQLAASQLFHKIAASQLRSRLRQCGQQLRGFVIEAGSFVFRSFKLSYSA